MSATDRKEAALDVRHGCRRLDRRRAAQVFGNPNFMTSEVLGYWRRPFRDEEVYVEVSVGEGILGGRVYGVTFRWPDGTPLYIGGSDPSKCFRSLGEAIKHMREAE